MGLNEEKPRTTFLSIMGGKITQTFKTEVPGGEARVVSKGKNKGTTVWDKKWPSITGIIQDIFVSTNDWGKQWNILILCPEQPENKKLYTLSMPYNSKPAKYFLMAIKNVDVTKPVVFSPWETTNKDTGTKSSSLYIKNEGQKESAEWFYTRENPNGLPDMVKTVINGQDMWDSTDQLNFLEKMVAEEIMPKIKPVEEAQGEESESSSTDKDDLPF